jgi:hypothetical protein
VRFEQWETFTPSEEDWDKLNELAENKFQRGKMQKKQMRIIRARGDKV